MATTSSGVIMSSSSMSSSSLREAGLEPLDVLFARRVAPYTRREHPAASAAIVAAVDEEGIFEFSRVLYDINYYLR